MTRRVGVKRWGDSARRGVRALVAVAVTQACLASSATGQEADAANADRDPPATLDKLIGEWTGTSTLWFAPETGRAIVREEGHMKCQPELGGNYIQCRVRFTRESGSEREMLIYYNYLDDEATNEVFFLFGGWDGKVTYRLTGDREDKNLFTGSFTDTDDDGVEFTEFIDLRWSDGGRRLRGWERIQSVAEPTGSYEQTFEVFWERVEGGGD